jgi:sec-independent protein translocase protein TatA
VPSIGPIELVIVLIIALVIFGPRKLPELGRSLGRGIREVRGSISEVRGSITGKSDSDGSVVLEDADDHAEDSRRQAS